jgi:prepilin-type N-terminal cleavage/methylation domain-containing protein
MKQSSRAGFTLLEIMLVIVLVALLAATVAPRIASVSRVGVSSSVRRYSGLVRFAYDNAILTGQLHRIVLDIDNQAWSVEAAQPGELPLDKVKEELRDKSDDEAEGKKDRGSFKKVGKNLIERVPNGVQIVSVESWRIGKGVAATKGEIAIYAYPSGFIDEATVVLAQAGKAEIQNFRITTKSLTGRTSVEVITNPEALPQ